MSRRERNRTAGTVLLHGSAKNSRTVAFRQAKIDAAHAIDRAARAEKGDFRLRVKSVTTETRTQLDAIRLILDPANPIGPRTCCYHLLSIGLLESTKQFDNMSKKINDARKRDEGDRDYLPDEAFRDASRVVEWREGWSGGIKSYISAYVNIYERDHWEDQKTVPIILCEKTGHGDFLRATRLSLNKSDCF